MSAANSVSVPPVLRGNFVLLRADRLRLLVSQSDVGAATHLNKDDTQEQAVVALSEQMLLLPNCPEDRYLVTPIVTSMGELGFGWTEVKVLIDAQLQPQALPATLVWENAPVKEFVEIDGDVAFLCDAKRMAEYVIAKRG